MLGLSLSKIVLTLAVLGGVWWLWRRFAQGAAAGRRSPAGAVRQKAARQVVVEDMAACPVCGTYVAKQGAARCAREDCPY